MQSPRGQLAGPIGAPGQGFRRAPVSMLSPSSPRLSMVDMQIAPDCANPAPRSPPGNNIRAATNLNHAPVPHGGLGPSPPSTHDITPPPAEGTGRQSAGPAAMLSVPPKSAGRGITRILSTMDMRIGYYLQSRQRNDGRSHENSTPQSWPVRIHAAGMYSITPVDGDPNHHRPYDARNARTRGASRVPHPVMDRSKHRI